MKMASTLAISSDDRVTFPRFLELPTEIQDYIWDLAIGECELLHVHNLIGQNSKMIPIVSISQLQPGDQPGLVPATLPPDMPRTLSSHPLPSGFPTATPGEEWEGVDDELYSRFFTGGNTCRFTDGDEDAVVRDGAWLLGVASVCRGSCLRLLRHVVIKNKPSYRPAQSLDLCAFKNGIVVGNIFTNQQTNRPCMVFALAQITSNLQHPFRPTKEFDPRRQNYVAARLGDIEKCVFGHRLSLKNVFHGTSNETIARSQRAMWWLPELGHRARRPEACHPFFLNPETIIAIYIEILHSLAFARERMTSSGHLAEDKCSMKQVQYIAHRGLDDGECRFCHRRLTSDAREHWGLIDDEGYLDVVVLLEREKYLWPEMTYSHRSYEVQ